MYGIRGKVLEWIKSWLKNRTQVVRYEKVSSEKLRVNIGKPQGTPLTCLMFNLYVNDAPAILRYCTMKMFADDAMLWIEGKPEEIDEMCNKMNCDICTLLNYYDMSKLKVNVKKTKYMVIGSAIQTNIPIVMKDELLDKVDEIKYLGIMIDNKLNFKSHLKYVEKKVSKKVYFLNRREKKTSVQIFSGTTYRLF